MKKMQLERFNYFVNCSRENGLRTDMQQKV
jgi:hypothetical protein